MAPLIIHFHSTSGQKGYVVVSWRSQCTCEDASVMVGWSPTHVMSVTSIFLIWGWVLQV